MPHDSSAFWQGARKDNPVKAEIFFLLLFLLKIWGGFFFFISLLEKEYLRSLLTAKLRALLLKSILESLKTSWEIGWWQRHEGKSRGGLGWHWGLSCGARAFGSAHCWLLWGPEGNGFIPQWEYPSPSLVIWEQSCLVSCASAVRTQSRHPRLDCLGVWM